MKIFSNPPEDADAAPTVNVTGADTASPAPQTAERSVENRPSLVGSDLKVIGTIIAETNLHIDGRVEGEIQSVNLTIGQGAVVEAQIIAEDIVVSGKVIGAIRADKIRFTGTAEVEGELVHRVFAIDSGAQFQGTVHHTLDPLERNGSGSDSATGASDSTISSTYMNTKEDANDGDDDDDAETESDEEKSSWS